MFSVFCFFSFVGQVNWQNGMTGPVQFTEDGYRKEIHLEILNLRNNSFQKVRVHHHYFTFFFLFYLSNKYC